MEELDPRVQILRIQTQRRRIEQQVEPRARQRPLRQVGADHMVGVQQQMQKLDAASRADVQGRGHLPAVSGCRQRQAGLPDAEHVVVRQGPGDLVGGEIAEHPQVMHRLPVLRLVRPQVSGGPDTAPGTRALPDGRLGPLLGVMA